MSKQQIDYAGLVEKALLRVVHDVLADVAEKGVPGRHHFYITFRTDHPDVVMDDALRARYPNEMTIVLEHEFWALDANDEGFGVTLKFNRLPQRLEVPYAAVTVFADPSVEFGLQFTRAGAAEAEAEAPAKLPATTDQDTATSTAPSAKPVTESDTGPEPETETAGTGGEDTDEEKVVTLDRFRKK